VAAVVKSGVLGNGDSVRLISVYRKRAKEYDRSGLRSDEIKPSPKLNAVIHDSLLLARTILERMERG
jgi:hypothetical protein